MRILVAAFLLACSALSAEDSLVRDSFDTIAPTRKPSVIYREKPQLSVPLLPLAPKLDGLSAPCWETAPAIALTDAAHTDQSARHATALVFFGSEGLHVCLICPLPLEKFQDKSVTEIDETLRSLSAATKHDWNVWQDESVELFVDPGHTGRYFQFICNTLNTQQESEGFVATWDGAWQSKVNLVAQNETPLPDSIAKRAELGLNKLTRFYWTCEVTIPYSTFGISAPKIGDVWGFNVVHNDKLSSQDYVWAHVILSNHEPASFGELHCVQETPANRFGAGWFARSPAVGLNRLYCSLCGVQEGLEVRCSASGPDGPKQAAAKLESSGSALIEFPITRAGRYDVALSIHKLGKIEALNTARFACEYEPPANPLDFKLDQKTYFLSERVARANIAIADPGARSQQSAEIVLISESGSEVSRGSLALRGAATEVEIDISSLKPGLYSLMVSVAGQKRKQSFARIAGPFDE